MSDYREIFQEFQNHDDLYARLFLENPMEFSKGLTNNPKVMVVYEDLSRIYGPLLAFRIMGGIAMMASQAVRPTDAIIKAAKGSIKFTSVSANGSFVVYKTCCPEPNNAMFLKIAKSDADYLEVEAIALQAFKKLVPKEYQKYLLTYCGSGQLLCKVKSTAYHFDIASYINGSIVTKGDPATYKTLPYLMTRAVPSGISMGSIINGWQYIANNQLPSNPDAVEASMNIFHADGLYKRALAQGGTVPILTEARAMLQRKFEDFVANIVRVGSLLKMSHADLHTSNILWDAVNDNFVMIDYGRVSFDLDAARVPFDFVWKEYLKLQSAPINQVWHDRIKLNLNNVFAFYRNHNSRHTVMTMGGNISKYNILIDLAGLFYTLQRDLLCGAFKSIHVDHPVFKHVKVNGQEFFEILGTAQIKNYLQSNSTLSLCDILYVFLAAQIHAVLQTTDTVFYKAQKTAVRTSTTVRVRVDAIVENGNNTLMYVWGQPTFWVYSKIIPALEAVLSTMGYFPVLERLVEAQLKKPQVGGKPLTKKNLERVANMTAENYKLRAKQMMRQNGKSVKSQR